MSPHHHLHLALGPLGTPELLVIFVLGLILALLLMLPFWFICKKAGLSPWLSLLTMLPFGSVVLTFILAFIEWPALRKDTAQLQ